MAAAQGLKQLEKNSQEEGNKANTYSAECLTLKIKLWHVAGNIAEVKNLQMLLSWLSLSLSFPYFDFMLRFSCTGTHGKCLVDGYSAQPLRRVSPNQHFGGFCFLCQQITE